MMSANQDCIRWAMLCQPLGCTDRHIKRFGPFLRSRSHHHLQEKTKFLRFFWTIGRKIDDIRALYMFQNSTHALVLYVVSQSRQACTAFPYSINRARPSQSWLSQESSAILASA